MIKTGIVISNNAPRVKCNVWAKPISGGFQLYVLDGASWKALKVGSENGIGTAATKSVDYFAPALKSGTFENKPASPAAGDSYFCTDKKTAATGAANGIIIYYNGTNWVDATGVTVS